MIDWNAVVFAVYTAGMLNTAWNFHRGMQDDDQFRDNVLPHTHNEQGRFGVILGVAIVVACWPLMEAIRALNRIRD